MKWCSDPRAYILDPCIQEFLFKSKKTYFWYLAQRQWQKLRVRLQINIHSAKGFASAATFVHGWKWMYGMKERKKIRKKWKLQLNLDLRSFFYHVWPGLAMNIATAVGHLFENCKCNLEWFSCTVIQNFQFCTHFIPIT